MTPCSVRATKAPPCAGASQVTVRVCPTLYPSTLLEAAGVVAVWVTALSPKESLNVNYFTPVCTFTPIPTPHKGCRIGRKGQSPGAMRGAQSKVTGQLTGLGAGRSYWAPGKYFWALGSHAERWAIITAGVSSHAPQRPPRAGDRGTPRGGCSESARGHHRLNE